MRLLKRFSAAFLAIIIVCMIMLTPVLPVSAASVTVTVSPSSGPPGTSVTVSGAFITGSIYTILFGTTITVGTGTVTGGGTIGTFILPVLPRGQYTVLVSSSAGDNAKYPLPTFRVTPKIYVSAASGGAADQITVSGNGFNANQGISINFDTINIGAATSDAQGAFPSTTINVPQSLAGNHTISAADQTGTSPSIPFSVAPKLVLSANEVTVGSTISISGTGFAAYKTLTFFMDDVYFEQGVTTDKDGKFTNINQVIGAMTGGNHEIKIQDTLANTAKITFVVDPSITILPANGPIGTKVTITGNGFLTIPDNPIVVTYNGITVTTNPDPVAVSNKGYFGANIVVPPGATGVGMIIVHDNFTTLSVNFNSSAAVTFGLMSGIVGTSITATGTGFKANTTITIKYDTVQAGTATTDSQGNFTATIPAPASSTGKHQVSITDQVSTLIHSFTITPDLNVNQTSGVVGTEIKINGTGFAANHTVTVKYDNNQITTATTDAKGTFAATFLIPASEGGNHQITISDGINPIITSPFTMDSTAPAVPVLISPHSITKASSLPLLDWQNVTDPSGVTYTLQISRDASFNLLVLEKEGLKTSEYQLTSQETLISVSKDQPYYWRVKAIDGANNESEWSSSFTFYVGTVIPTQIYFAAVGVLVVIVGGVSFLIERTRKH